MRGKGQVWVGLSMLVLTGAAYVWLVTAVVLPQSATVDDARVPLVSLTVGFALVAVATLLVVTSGERSPGGASPRVTAEHRLLAAQRRELAGQLLPRLARGGRDVLLAVRFLVAELTRLHRDDEPSVRLLHDLERRCAELESQVRRLERVGDGDGEPDDGPVRTRELLEDVVTTASLGPTSIRSRVDVDGPTELELALDAARLRQAVSALTLNAIEATGAGGAVELRAVTDAESLTIEVHDDGPGIVPDQRAEVVMPFHSSKDGASGLGLWAADAIARACGGLLELEDSELGGVCARLVVPRRGVVITGGGSSRGRARSSDVGAASATAVGPGAA